MQTPAIRLTINLWQYIKTPILVDARLLVLSLFLFTALSWRPSDPGRMSAAVLPPVVHADPVENNPGPEIVPAPVDALTAYVLDEIGKIETKLKSDGDAIDADQNSPFEVAVFEVYRREGYRPKPYRCPAGLETIGFGDVIDTDAERELRSTGMPFSQARAKVYSNLESGAAEIERRFPGKYTKPNEWLALTLLGHSIGWDRLEAKYPAFYREIASGKPSARWLKYCRYRDGKTKAVKCSPNLVRTRKVEWLLFNGDFAALRDYHADAARVAKIRWAKGRKDSLQRLGRE